MSITTIAFDGDDTLWHCENIFALTEQRICEMLADYADPHHLAERLLAHEKANLEIFGYGVKGFTLSMIETAIEISEGRVPAEIIQRIIDSGKDMLAHPVEPIAGIRPVLEQLARRFNLVLITKGDLFDQESKIARSGLGELFDWVEIVSEKDEEVYRRTLTRHGDGPEKAVMIGNSVRSDILPMIAAGGWAVHIPYQVTWEHERAEPPLDHPRFVQMDSAATLPGWLDTVQGRESAII